MLDTRQAVRRLNFGGSRRVRGTHQPRCGQNLPVQSLESWDVERRPDGAVLVRVHSRNVNGRALPDAVFAFRAGDPQYNYWEEQLRHRETPAAPRLPWAVS